MYTENEQNSIIVHTENLRRIFCQHNHPVYNTRGRAAHAHTNK